MARKIWRKYERELKDLSREMKLEAKLYHRSLSWEEANMHQERYSLLKEKQDEIMRKAEFEVEDAYAVLAIA